MSIPRLQMRTAERHFHGLSRNGMRKLCGGYWNGTISIPTIGERVAKHNLKRAPRHSRRGVVHTQEEPHCLLSISGIAQELSGPFATDLSRPLEPHLKKIRLFSYTLNRWLPPSYTQMKLSPVSC